MKPPPLMRIELWLNDLKSGYLTIRRHILGRKNAKVCCTKYSLFAFFLQCFAKHTLLDAKTFFGAISFADRWTVKIKRTSERKSWCILHQIRRLVSVA